MSDGSARLHAMAAEIERERYARRFGDPMRCDPRFYDSGGDALMIRRACQYSAAIMRKRGELPEDASAYEARLVGRAVVFSKGGALAAVHRIPDRVMVFNPAAPVKRERDA